MFRTKRVKARDEGLTPSALRQPSCCATAGGRRGSCRGYSRTQTRGLAAGSGLANSKLRKQVLRVRPVRATSAARVTRDSTEPSEAIPCSPAAPCMLALVSRAAASCVLAFRGLWQLHLGPSRWAPVCLVRGPAGIGARTHHQAVARRTKIACAPRITAVVRVMPRVGTRWRRGEKTNKAFTHSESVGGLGTHSKHRRPNPVLVRQLPLVGFDPDHVKFFA